MRQLLTLLFCLCCAGPLAAQLPLQLTTTDGTVLGAAAELSGVSVFRGLPYAAPPVGENRWRAPQPVATWAGVRDATHFAPRCVQGGFAPGADQALTSEDCLYLNVWTPATAADEALPVLFWIHGGGFFTGSGSAVTYDGSNLAALGAVVVTINYRLGSFGFLAHPELSAESPEGSSGNYALLDMVAALQWVQRNIAAFGGDSERVTIVGESAGAQAVGLLLATPLSEGLFHRAVLQSGAFMGLSLARLPTLATQEAQGMEQVAAFGADSIAALRQASAQQIFERFPSGGSVNVDGWVLPADPALLFAGGRQHKVDILAGSNRDEAIFFGPGLQSASALRDYASDKFGNLAAAFLALYPAHDDAGANQSYQRAFSDELAWHIRLLGRYQADAGQQAWLYYFTHVPPGQEARGATHVAELAYMFNQHGQNPAWTAVDRQLGETMARYWVNFARSGNPNGADLPEWPAFHDNSPGSVIVLGDEVAAETEQRPNAAALEFFDTAYAQHLEALD